VKLDVRVGAAALGAVLALAACGSGGAGDDGAARACRDAAEWLGAARVHVEVPLAVAADARVTLVRDGSARLGVPLHREDGRVERADGRAIHYFDLPLPANAAVTSDRFRPELVGLPIPRLVPGVELAPDQTAAFWVAGAQLVVVLAGDATLPERFELLYPVHAARLAGTALIAGYDPREVFATRRLRDEVSVAALAVAGGTRLQLTLPELAPGRFEAAVSAVGTDAEVELTLGERVLFAGDAPAAGEPRSIAVEQGAVAAGDVLELTVGGGPDALVLFDGPLFVRPREARDAANVVLVVVDTLRADRLGAWGAARDLAPRLDALTAQSVVFEEAWATSSWTLPSVTTMLTSNHGGQHRADLNTQRLGTGIDTLAEVFAGAGYRTAAFTGGGFVGPAFGLDRGFQLMDARGGGVDAVVERARAFLDRAGEGPWFLLLHTYEVHAPYQPPPDVMDEIVARYPGLLDERGPEPHWFYAEAEEGDGLRPEVTRLLAELYDAEVRFTDEVLGAFLDGLSSRGLLADAVVGLTSDHGEEFGEHGLLGHGDTLYREQLHVPLSVRLPGAARGGERVAHPVSLLDLAPTLLDAAGLAARLDATTFEGRSLLGDDEPSPIFAQRNSEEVGMLEATRRDAAVWIRGAYYHRVPRTAGDGPELYHLDTDPWQATNLAPNADTAEATELERRLNALSEHFGQARVEDARALPEAGVRAQLDALGYGGR
jgi:arylsulfatase A-like enzyme